MFWIVIEITGYLCIYVRVDYTKKIMSLLSFTVFAQAAIESRKTLAFEVGSIVYASRVVGTWKRGT